jgi:HD-GYP domain-containing protein (c-di-GMP phosphodiesterase class II)
MKFSDLNKKKESIIRDIPVDKKKSMPLPDKSAEPEKNLLPSDLKEGGTEKKESSIRDITGDKDESKLLLDKPAKSRKDSLASDLNRKKEERDPEKQKLQERDTAYVYYETMKTSKDLLEAINEPYVEKYYKLKMTCIRNCEILQNNNCLGNFLHHATAENYLFAHTANVSLICQSIGFELNLDKSSIIQLGICALLHDIGLMDFIDIARKETKLNEHEFYQIQKHSEIGAEKLDRIVDIDYGIKDKIKNVILQVHERVDGSGYPQNLSGVEIDFFAQIIGVVDVYEALTHPRSWRKSLHPHNAIKYLIDREGKNFDSRIVRSLIKIFSIYPPGAIIRLSTGEIARVIRINKNSLTRPWVEIILNADFSPVQTQLIDLAKYPLTSIKDIVMGEEFSAKNNKFFAQLEFSRWITDW